MSEATPDGRLRPPSHFVIDDHWYVACLSADLSRTGARPIKRTILGLPLVLFRDAQGRAAALVDRCPHRNAPLSFGRIRPDDRTLECGYHGWRFDGAGRCQAVPALCLGEGASADTEGRRAEALPVVEAQGYVWVIPKAGAPAPGSAPFEFPRLGEGYTTVRDTMVAPSPVFAAVENALDVPHTAFLHGGLFRRADKPRTVIDVVVRSDAAGCEAEYVGEPRPSGLAARVLAPGGGEVTHFDRFFLPSVAQVEYGLGDTSHFVVTTAMTPVDEWESLLYAEVTFRLPLPAWLVRVFVTPIARRIFAQDAKILALQSETIRRFGGERFVSTEIDVLGRHIQRLMRAASTGAPAPVDAQRRIQLEI